MGVDSFKTDFGERIPTGCPVLGMAVYPYRMHNYYTYLYNKTVSELLERKKGKGEAVLFARPATAGNQKYPVHWGGDCESGGDYQDGRKPPRRPFQSNPVPHAAATISAVS